MEIQSERLVQALLPDRVPVDHVDRAEGRSRPREQDAQLAVDDRAIERGATAIEAYPGDQSDYKGRLSWFLDEGFVPVREIGKRTLVRYDVASPVGGHGARSGSLTPGPAPS